MNVVSGGPPSPGKEKAGKSDSKNECDMLLYMTFIIHLKLLHFTFEQISII